MYTPSTSSEEGVSSRFLLFSHTFPHDRLSDLFESLQRWSRERRLPLLATFLKECTFGLKEEILSMPRQMQDAFPPPQSIMAWVENLEELQKSPAGGALEGALLCVLELGMLIGHYESQDILYDLPVSDRMVLAGMSIGLFSAAAVATSSSLFELAHTGSTSVRVAFRFGLHVGQISHMLEPQGEVRKSWAYVVTGLDVAEVQDALDAYNTDTKNSDICRVCISHADSISVGITGPPSRLESLFRHSPVLRNAKRSPLPIYGGLCHVSHIYSQEDVHEILKGFETAKENRRPVYIPLLSPNSGKPFAADDAAQLYEAICTEALTMPLFPDKLSSGITLSLSSVESKECEVYQFHRSVASDQILASIGTSLPSIQLKPQNLMDWIHKETNLPNPNPSQKLAIVGMSCRLPGGANDPELFWKLLMEGRNTCTTVPQDRFDLKTHFDPSGKTINATESPFGNFIDHPGLFDSGFFNMSPREADQTDPMQRLALVTAYEALEMSGYAPDRTASTCKKRVGTFYGQASDDYRETNAGQQIGTYGIPGGERAFGNGRINYFFNFGGPSFNIDTACSSGLAAVNAACSSLWAGETDMVIAGGLNVITNSDIYCMLSKGHFLSKTGQCKVWDKSADGYCRSDGVGSVVIKKLEDAQADNDPIIATIVSGATNHSCEAVSITHPHAGAQKDNYRQVMHTAGVSPLDVSYVELHGTGTQAGDGVESESVASVFAPLTQARQQRLHLGAVKANIGHGEAAAGVTSLIKVLLAFENEEIPRHIGITTEINPIVMQNTQNRNTGLVMEHTKWPRPEKRGRYAIVNSFGAHGGNTTLLLEDAPRKPKVTPESRAAYPITLSAKSKASLKENTKALIHFIDANPDVTLGDLSYTTCARRMHHHTRIATSATDKAQLRRFLESSIEKVESLRPVPATAPGVAFVFTGQGAFYRGAAAQLLRSFPFFRDQVAQLDKVSRNLGFPSVFATLERTEEVNNVSPILSQLAILVLEIALLKLWELLGIRPSFVMGHSLGEYVALVAAKVLSPADAIYLVGRRAELVMDSCTASSHAMLSVRASVEEIRNISESHVYEISCMNDLKSTVISGVREEIEIVRSTLEASGIKCTELDLPFAFHTAQLDPILDELEQTARHITFHPPQIPIISTLLGKCIFDGNTVNAKYLRRASREPVNFLGAMNTARELGITEEAVWLEVGHHALCSSFVKSHVSDGPVVQSLRKGEDNHVTLTKAMAAMHCEGLPVCWNEYFKPEEHSYNVLRLGAYRWNNKNHWIQYEGTWALDKGNAQRGKQAMPSGQSIDSTSVQQIVSQKITESTVEVTAVTDVKRSDFMNAVLGHTINGIGVVSASIWTDMALTLGSYLYKLIAASDEQPSMNLTNMLVQSAQKLDQSGSGSQMLQIEATLDQATSTANITWYTQSVSGQRSKDSFATATVTYENPTAWTREWERQSHLLKSRIDTLMAMASTGGASRLSRSMVYELFRNIVDYSPLYQGMQSVVLNQFEACAEICLPVDRHGKWHTPPHWTDSLFQLAGFVMNGSDVTNTKQFAYITPGWKDLRCIESFEPGVKYTSYVHMIPEKGDPNTFLGDLYVLRGNEIVGLLREIKFRRIPRALLGAMFATPAAAVEKTSATQPTQALLPKPLVPGETTLPSRPPVVETSSPTVVVNEPAVITDCLRLIGHETGYPPSDLSDEATFPELGVDSLMSLVLAEKFRNELRLEVRSSLFLECPTVKEFKDWIKQYC
ncbi:unnamed protein product [Penicillium nalgiovense]|uniref:Carrier domain-containing protein n=1 Tax=Penicillium nalgiovense TaxID=60175 RepID=A0A9W4HCF8_PENNA|nr:unnamed protein product [Penicillium nalgiovense]CAG7947833.1 unnamed protein product [Penicillium nalgiovense]CAG7966734.1 unnamed protein product [Penicillium nalgiovense]CAG7978214.1 unnamed protein product [Penicillium nalgiovense]CAG7982690.1 unnamed protein product [Penicillium nalgiovense]